MLFCTAMSLEAAAATGATASAVAASFTGAEGGLSGVGAAGFVTGAPTTGAFTPAVSETAAAATTGAAISDAAGGSAGGAASDFKLIVSRISLLGSSGIVETEGATLCGMALGLDLEAYFLLASSLANLIASSSTPHNLSTPKASIIFSNISGFAPCGTGAWDVTFGATTATTSALSTIPSSSISELSFFSSTKEDAGTAADDAKGTSFRNSASPRCSDNPNERTPVIPP
mmetsp:Transcript_3684/g.5354  ORF Transcript_3684/g.5354 Transcript_3684/m.5354 type:complete len:230 (+) Transcript_3684:558-1247(+)